MTLARRLAAGGLATVIALALTSIPALAATKSVATPRPAARPVAPQRLAARPVAPQTPVRAIGVLPPQIYQLNPLKVNPTVLPNIMIVGQHLTPATTVQVGGRPATTVEVPDANHLLMKLPENLSQGSYLVAVTNEAGTTMSSDQLVIDDPGLHPSTMMMLVGGGFLLMLVLVMRLARTPTFA